MRISGYLEGTLKVSARLVLPLVAAEASACAARRWRLKGIRNVRPNWASIDVRLRDKSNGENLTSLPPLFARHPSIIYPNTDY
jgi:hypothetical protein